MTDPVLGVPVTVTGAFRTAVARHPDAVAVSYYAERWTFADIEDASCRLANAFEAQGVGRGDRLAVFVHNVPEFLIWFLAAAQRAAIVVPVNPQLTAAEVSYVLDDANPRIMLVSGETVARAVEATTGRGVDLVLIPRTIEAPLTREAPPPPGVVAFDELRGGAPTGQDLAEPDEALVLWYTSGTTGRPKGAVATHQSFLYNSEALLGVLGPSAVRRTMKPTPMSGTGFASTMFGPLLHGAEVHLLSRVSSAEMLDTIMAAGITFFGASPSVVDLIVNAAERAQVSGLPSVEAVQMGGAPPSSILLEGFGVVFPRAALHHCYGCSETMVSVCLPSAPGDKRASVGKPFAGTRVRIVDSAGATVPTGEEGLVAVSGPGVMLGYWRRPDATQRALRDGWVTVGDLGHVDDDGYLWLTGRDSDVINSGGYNVYASEVERVLADVPGVDSVAVVAEPDSFLGERVIAHVGTVQAPEVVVEGLRQAVIDQLAKYKRPMSYLVWKALPITSLGKVQKHKLGERTDGSVRRFDELTRRPLRQ